MLLAELVFHLKTYIGVYTRFTYELRCVYDAFRWVFNYYFAAVNDEDCSRRRHQTHTRMAGALSHGGTIQRFQSRDLQPHAPLHAYAGHPYCVTQNIAATQ